MCERIGEVREKNQNQTLETGRVVTSSKEGESDTLRDTTSHSDNPTLRKDSKRWH